MGFEIPLDVDYIDHPKTLRLLAALGKLADVYPLRLWCWCAKYAKDGVVRGGVQELEKAVRWTGEAGKCHKAMVDAGFLNRDGKTVHDWQIHAGRKIKQYERKKALQREKYNQGEPPAETESSENLPEDCRNSSTMQGGSLPPLNETKRNETKLDQTKTNEMAFSELAQEATFLQGKGTKPSAVSEWHSVVTDLFACGISLESIRAELHKPKGDGQGQRLHGEPTWDFKERLMKAKKDKPQDRSAALREAMKKEGHG